MTELFLEHVEDELALHGILDKFIFADVSVSLLVNSISESIKFYWNEYDHLRRHSPYIRDTDSYQIIVFLNSRQSEESHDNVPDLVHVNGAPAVCVEGGEDPVEFVLGGVELGDVVGLEELVETELATLVFVKHSEQRLGDDPG